MGRYAPLDNQTAEILTALITELATELDMHYEDHELRLMCQPTIETLRRACTLLRNNGYPSPPVCDHVVARFLKQHQ